jgi:hypothetical protein
LFFSAKIITGALSRSIFIKSIEWEVQKRECACDMLWGIKKCSIKKEKGGVVDKKKTANWFCSWTFEICPEAR